MAKPPSTKITRRPKYTIPGLTLVALLEDDEAVGSSMVGKSAPATSSITQSRMTHAAAKTTTIDAAAAMSAVDTGAVRVRTMRLASMAPGATYVTATVMAAAPIPRETRCTISSTPPRQPAAVATAPSTARHASPHANCTSSLGQPGHAVKEVASGTGSATRSGSSAPSHFPRPRAAAIRADPADAPAPTPGANAARPALTAVAAACGAASGGGTGFAGRSASAGTGASVGAVKFG
mmetsp:Transcript_40028/g.123675  ORF Transcript_40028/g.123675 Transcript_40028/m.123675 type:complete len:236 (+) Transcript_40028:720-1427(+)